MQSKRRTSQLPRGRASPPLADLLQPLRRRLLLRIQLPRLRLRARPREDVADLRHDEGSRGVARGDTHETAQGPLRPSLPGQARERLRRMEQGRRGGHHPRPRRPRVQAIHRPLLPDDIRRLRPRRPRSRLPLRHPPRRPRPLRGAPPTAEAATFVLEHPQRDQHGARRLPACALPRRGRSEPDDRPRPPERRRPPRTSRQRAGGSRAARRPPSDLRPIYATAFYAGLRRGELAASAGRTSDLAGGTIHVRRGYDEKAGEIAPKSRERHTHGSARRAPTRHPRGAQDPHGRRANSLRVPRSPQLQPFTPTAIRRKAARAWATENERRTAQADERAKRRSSSSRSDSTSAATPSCRSCTTRGCRWNGSVTTSATAAAT